MSKKLISTDYKQCNNEKCIELKHEHISLSQIHDELSDEYDKLKTCESKLQILHEKYAEVLASTQRGARKSYKADLLESLNYKMKSFRRNFVNFKIPKLFNHRSCEQFVENETTYDRSKSPKVIMNAIDTPDSSSGVNRRGSPSELCARATGGGSMCLEHTFPGEKKFTYDLIQESADYVMSKTKYRPHIGIICGSGLGGLADQLVNRDIVRYEEIPNFPVSTVPGHAGRLVIGILNGVPVMCMQGRFHSYEGYELWKCAMPVRVMKIIGVTKLIVTNAAGGLNPEYNVGDIMIIKDHVNMQGFAGDSPLKGRNEERFGPRFPAMNNCYDKAYRKLAMDITEELGLRHVTREGVYVMLGGPTYETVAELKLLRLLGVDAVGMSTVPEVVVAKHCGMKVFAFSLITNECIVDYDTVKEANHEEVIEVANKRKLDLQNLVQEIVPRMVD